MQTELKRMERSDGLVIDGAIHRMIALWLQRVEDPTALPWSKG